MSRVAVAVRKEGGGDRFGFDWITSGCSRSVCLKVLTAINRIVYVKAGPRIAITNKASLSRCAGSGKL